MAEKNFNTRIIHKHDTEANWLKAENFIPKKGELIVYDKDVNYSYSRFKIGDGETFVNNLPFSMEQSDWNQTDEAQPDYIKNKPELGGLPKGEAPHQQLVTDADGNTVWEDKLCWSTIEKHYYI